MSNEFHYMIIPADSFSNMDLLISAWLSNHMPSKVWDEIIYPFLNYNGGNVEVKIWIGNLIQHFVMDASTYLCWKHVSKRDPNFNESSTLKRVAQTGKNGNVIPPLPFHLNTYIQEL